MNIMPLIKEDYINVIDKTAKHFDIFLDEDMGAPSLYREFLSILFNATEYDSINIYINCQGGQLDTAFAIIEGIKNTQAMVTGVMIGACHSAASMIMLHCHNVIVTDSAYAMIHTASYGSSGNTSNVKAHTDFTYKQIDKLLTNTYEGFLSKEELESVKKGVEIWLSADEIEERIKKRVKMVQKKMKTNLKNSKECSC